MTDAFENISEKIELLVTVMLAVLGVLTVLLLTSCMMWVEQYSESESIWIVTGFCQLVHWSLAIGVKAHIPSFQFSEAPDKCWTFKSINIYKWTEST